MTAFVANPHRVIGTAGFFFFPFGRFLLVIVAEFLIFRNHSRQLLGCRIVNQEHFYFGFGLAPQSRFGRQLGQNNVVQRRTQNVSLRQSFHPLDFGGNVIFRIQFQIFVSHVSSRIFCPGIQQNLCRLAELIVVRHIIAGHGHRGRNQRFVTFNRLRTKPEEIDVVAFFLSFQRHFKQHDGFQAFKLVLRNNFFLNPRREHLQSAVPISGFGAKFKSAFNDPVQILAKFESLVCRCQRLGKLFFLHLRFNRGFHADQPDIFVFHDFGGEFFHLVKIFFALVNLHLQQIDYRVVADKFFQRAQIHAGFFHVAGGNACHRPQHQQQRIVKIMAVDDDFFADFVCQHVNRLAFVDRIAQIITVGFLYLSHDQLAQNPIQEINYCHKNQYQQHRFRNGKAVDITAPVHGNHAVFIRHPHG